MKVRPPIVLMTGTCGPSMESPMLENLGLSRIRTIRARTNRPEIMYTVHPMEPMGEHRIAPEVQKWFEANLKARLEASTSQALIYVQSKVIGSQIAQRLRMDFFESGTPTEEKHRMYEGFKSGAVQCLVATQAFGAGVDIGSVDVVIHAGSPRSMVDFAQESGRAGRKGQPALSIVFRSSGTFRPSKEIDANCGREEMQSWLSRSSECRRLGLGQFLDGLGRGCPMLPGAQLCDVCRTNGATPTTVEQELFKQLDSNPVVIREVPLSGSTERSCESTALAGTPTEGASGSWLSESSIVRTPNVISPYESTATRPLIKTGSSSSTMSQSRIILESADRPSMGKIHSTASNSAAAKRKLTATPPTRDTIGNKRRLVERLASASYREVTSPEGRLEAAGSRSAKRNAAGPLYADLSQPSLRLFIRKKQVCFTCVGLGWIQKCPNGECAVEKTMMENEGEKNMMPFVNKLANEIKFDIRAMGYCGKCFLPAPRGEPTNVFHPSGTAPGAPCVIFQMVATKALSAGCRLWQQKLRESPIEKKEDDPLWLVDLLDNGRTVDEPTVQAFARILKSPCGSGEHWFLRIFYHMVKQAVEEDEGL